MAGSQHSDRARRHFYTLTPDGLSAWGRALANRIHATKEN